MSVSQNCWVVIVFRTRIFASACVSSEVEAYCLVIIQCMLSDNFSLLRILPSMAVAYRLMGRVVSQERHI